MAPVSTGRVSANGVEFAYLECGSGPLALCLHGFPDTAHTYRHLLPALADAGLRAVAPFLRGYAPSSVPADGRYDGATLGADANALHEALGGGPDAVLVGHDWGASAAYTALGAQPQHWRRAVTMAVPPAAALAQTFLSYQQIRRSFYMYFFQLPLAEMVVPAEELAFLAGLWQDWEPGYDATEDLARVRDALADPAHLTAALGYYRALFAGLGDGGGAAATAPTLYLHGADDGCIGLPPVPVVEAALPAGSRVQVVEHAGHFLHLRRPAEVNPLVVDWLAP